MNSYYLTLVLKPDLEEKARQELLDDVKKKMVGDGGTASAPASAFGSTESAVKENIWGARDLAYPIKKQTKGFYVHFEFETEPTIAKGLDKQLKVEEDIIRFLLVRNDLKSQNSKINTKKGNEEKQTR